ncbi:hypothetical protein TcCL_Unassigned02508 [Trypanosoma cruzi]|nr:hypothetical protein TcCL_Unassigned02508 [Trypanosoma cruzi]
MPSCAQVFFSTCSVDVHSNSEVSGAMCAWNSSCHVDCGQHREAATLTPQSFCVSLRGWQGNSMQPATAGVSLDVVTPCEQCASASEGNDWVCVRSGSVCYFVRARNTCLVVKRSGAMHGRVSPIVHCTMVWCTLWC